MICLNEGWILVW